MYLSQGMESYKYDEIVRKGVYNSLSDHQMGIFDKKMKSIIGEDNCMRFVDWENFMGLKQEIVIDIMTNKGYVIKTTRKKTTLNPARSQRYYFEQE